MIPLHAIRNVVSGLVTVGQQFLADTSEADHPTAPPANETGPGNNLPAPATETAKKRGRPAKVDASAADQQSSTSEQPKASATPPVNRDMIRSAFGAYMAIPGVGQEKGKKLLADFGFEKLSAVPDEKLAELYALVVSTTQAASAPDPFAA